MCLPQLILWRFAGNKEPLLTNTPPHPHAHTLSAVSDLFSLSIWEDKKNGIRGRSSEATRGETRRIFVKEVTGSTETDSESAHTLTWQSSVHGWIRTVLIKIKKEAGIQLVDWKRQETPKYLWLHLSALWVSSGRPVMSDRPSGELCKTKITAWRFSLLDDTPEAPAWCNLWQLSLLYVELL